MSQTATPSIPEQGQAEEAKSSFDTGQVLTITAGHSVHDTYSAFLAPLLPALIDRFSLSNTQAGLLSSFRELASVFQPVIGYLADRISLRYLVILAPGITATVMSLLGVVPYYGVVALLLFVAGLSSAGMHAVGPVMAGRVSGDRLGRGMSYWMVGGEFGRTVGPILVVSVITWRGLESTPWLMVGGWAATALLYFRLRNIPGKPIDGRGRSPWRAVIRQMRPFLVALSLLQIVRSFTSVALTTYLPVFLKESGASLWWAGASLSILEAAGVIGALTGGSLSDRVGRRRILTGALAMTSLLILVFLYIPANSRTFLLPLLGFFSLSTTPVIMALVQESYPDNRAMANGVYMALSFIIRSVVVVLFGGVSDLFGLDRAYLLSAILLFAGLPIIRLFPEKIPAHS